MATQDRFAAVTDELGAVTSQLRVEAEDLDRATKNGIDPQRLHLKVNNLQRTLNALKARRQ